MVDDYSWADSVRDVTISGEGVNGCGDRQPFTPPHHHQHDHMAASFSNSWRYTMVRFR